MMPQFVKRNLDLKAQAGFTLLEMVVVVVIAGIVLAYLGAFLLSFSEGNRIKTTEYNLTKVQEAVDRYLSVTGRYPCPASRFLDSEDTEFGKQITDVTGGDCDAAAGAGGSTVLTSGIHIGAVPNRTIHIADEYALDGWGRKLTYAVTAAQATIKKYRADNGRVQLRGTGANIISNDSHYIIISHGKTGDGAYPNTSGNLRAVPCSGGATIDGENCDDNDRVFRLTLVNPSETLSEFFDDYAYTKMINVTSHIPAGAVAGFAATSCPVGWTRFSQAEGHFIIGAQDNVLAENKYIKVDKDPAGNFSDDISTHSTQGEDAEAIVPAYVTLLYCEKLPS